MPRPRRRSRVARAWVEVGWPGRVVLVPQTSDTVITEALTVIDRSLPGLASRELVSAAEMSDLLLDLRLLLMSAEVEVAEAGLGEGPLPG